MHTLLDYDGHLPAYVNITDGKTADNKGVYDIPLLKASVIVADRFYNDFSLLNIWDSSEVYFVVRHKENIKFKTLKELELSKERHGQVLKDEIIELTGTKTKEKYPKKMRRVALWDEKNQQTIEVITNQMSWIANTITELVMIQIWTALITILILKALKTQANHGWYLSNLVAFIRLNLFVKVDLHKWLDNPFEKEKPPPEKYTQRVLF